MDPVLMEALVAAVEVKQTLQTMAACQFLDRVLLAAKFPEFLGIAHGGQLGQNAKSEVAAEAELVVPGGPAAQAQEAAVQGLHLLSRGRRLSEPEVVGPVRQVTMRLPVQMEQAVAALPGSAAEPGLTTEAAAGAASLLFAIR